MRPPRPERGNILFLILLAVVLFAALSYAVTNSMRGGGNDATKENAQAAAAAILQQATLMEQTISRLRLTNNCRDSEFDFSSPVDAYTAHGTVTWPSDNHCDLFDAAGGGMTYPAPSKSWLDPLLATGTTSTLWGKWYFAGFTCINNIGTGSAPDCTSGGTAASELIAYLPYLTKDVCQAINDTIPIAPVSGSPIAGYNTNGVNDTGAAKFDGRYITGARFANEQNGQSYGCYDRGSGTYVQAYLFYKVLLAR